MISELQLGHHRDLPALHLRRGPARHPGPGQRPRDDALPASPSSRWSSRLQQRRAEKLAAVRPDDEDEAASPRSRPAGTRSARPAPPRERPPAADRRRARRRRRRRRSRSRTRSRPRRSRPSARPRPSSSTPPSPRRATAFEAWSTTPAGERGEMLHEVARRLRENQRGARPDDDRRGRQAADREPRRDRLVRGRVRLLRRDRPRQRRPGDPADRVEPAGDGRQGPARRRRLHRPLELPAAAAHLEGRPGARRRLHGRRQAVGGDAALDPAARRLLRPPARRASST